MQLKDKRIIVTGGASGIGAAVVKVFAEEGARVASLDLQAGVAWPGVLGQVCDVADPASVEQAFATACEHLGGLDVLVHAAAIAPNVAVDDLTLEQWQRVMAVNAGGTFLTNRAARQHMVAGGRIINFASAAGVIGQPGKAHYTASKGAVLAWTRTVAREWGPSGITVNAICPAMWTPMYEATRASMNPHTLAGHDAFMASHIPLGGRLGDSERDLAPVLVFLAGDGARFVTGQTLMIDGGMVMH